MTAFDFIKWCFSDSRHGVWTILIAGLAVDGVCRVVRAARGKSD